MTKKSLVTFAASFGLIFAACGGGPEDEYREAVPTESAIAFTMPQRAQQAATPGKKTSALIGQLAELYTVTYVTSRTLNATVWVGLKTIETIVQHRPSSLKNGAATWGPFTPPLSRVTYLLVVKREARPGHYSYVLSARRKLDVKHNFVPIIAGTSVRGVAGFKGVYTADASALNALDPVFHRHTGKLVATYDTTFGRRIAKMAIKGHTKNGGKTTDLVYDYHVGVRGAGLFRFVAKTDLQRNNSADEVFAMVSAWNEKGAGRGEAAITGGDLPSGTVVHMTECWNPRFARTFYQDSKNLRPQEGDISACVLGKQK